MVEIPRSSNVLFMSYSTCWNCRQTWNLCFLLIFSWKKLGLNFAFWDTFKLLKCLNSKEIKLQSSIRVICTSFRSDFFFSWKLKRKQRFNIQHQYDMIRAQVCKMGLGKQINLYKKLKYNVFFSIEIPILVKKVASFT